MERPHDNDPLGAQIDALGAVAQHDDGLLAALAMGSILVLLARPPGEGTSRPERNLVEWHDASANMKIVPLFTAAQRLPGTFPPPVTLTRVPMRLLLSLTGPRHYVVNPLSPVRLVLSPARVAAILDVIAAQSGETRVPSSQVPWGFKHPPDNWHPIALALATWIAQDGRVDRAFLYELFCGEESPRMILGLEVATAPDMAAALRAVALHAGAAPGALTVRFLPDEPSHAHGVYGMGLAPFYDRADTPG